jgi:hypothetical protein
MSNPNPYQSPKWDSQPPRQDFGMVHQVRVVCILMGVQGVLELLAGLLYGAMGIFMPVMIQQMQQDPAFQKGNGPDPEVMFWIFGGVYMGMGAIAILAGVLHIWAGIRNYSFRGRTLGLVAMILGLGSMATCYCLPTTIAIAVYGLIVYLNGPVIRAFDLGRQGLDSDQILATFSPSYPAYPPPDQFR